MAMGNEEFTAEELALIPNDDGEGGQQADDAPQGQAPAAPAATTDTAAPAAPAANAPAPAAPAAPAPAQGGDVRAALRASRRSEHLARQEAERLRRENEELRAKAGTQPAEDPDAISDDEIRRAEAVDPLLAKVARVASRAAAPAPAPAVQAPQPEFRPPVLPPEVQNDVDDVPDLLGWQNNPDQTLFKAAVHADAYLLSLPEWASKTQVERLKEVVRRVQADHAIAPSQTTNPPADPRERIANAPRQQPHSLSDIGAGGGRQPERPLLERMQAAKSDDEVIALLELGGG